MKSKISKSSTSEEAPVRTKTDVKVTFLSAEEKDEPVRKKGIILGLLEGKIDVGDDFNDPLDDMKDYM